MEKSRRDYEKGGGNSPMWPNKYSDNKYGALDFRCYIVVLHKQSAFIKRVVDYCI